MIKFSAPKKCGGVLAGACLLVVVWFIVISIVGTPRGLLHMLSVKSCIMSSWLFLVLATIYYILCGAAAGKVLCLCRWRGEIYAYRGLFFLSVAITLGYLWYALFFGAGYFLPAALLACASFLCLTVAALNFRVFSYLSVHLIWVCAAVSAYFLIVSIFSFFCL